MALQSPFASSDAQVGKAQPEAVKPAANRKRARCSSSDLDSKPLSKISQLSSRQQSPPSAAVLGPAQVTLHRPTPHRPTASTPCCFDFASAAHQLQLNQVRSPSSATSRPISTAMPLAQDVVPTSLPTAAALVSVVKSGTLDPSDDDRGSPTQPARSQECKHCQGQFPRTHSPDAMHDTLSAMELVIWSSSACCASCMLSMQQQIMSSLCCT